MRKVGWIAAILIMLPALLAGVARAETADVTIGVGDTILQVEGKTSPDAFVTIRKDGAVIGTVTANAAGEFQQTFPAQDPGIHEIGVFAQTTGGHNTDTITTNVNITEHGTTTVSIFLPSTLQMEQPFLAQGQPLQLSGESAPSSTIVIYVDNSNYATATTDSQGNWQVTLSVATLPPGQHELFVRTTDGFGDQSYPTTPRYFTIAAPLQSIPPVTPGQGGLRAPVITFPQTGTVWHEPVITIQGTAGRGVQVELWDGSHIVGSVWSDPEGNWSMALQLEQRGYELRARACLDQRCSAFSPTIRFNYVPAQAGDGNPLRVIVPRSAFTVYQNQPVTLRAIVLEGNPPYRIHIQWGDGKTETLEFAVDDLSFTHVYAQPGKYTVTVDIEDSRGREKTISYTVEVKPAEAVSLINLAWLALLILLLALLIAIWLIKRRRKARRDNQRPKPSH
jgi:hypothetical protein